MDLIAKDNTAPRQRDQSDQRDADATDHPRVPSGTQDRVHDQSGYADFSDASNLNYPHLNRRTPHGSETDSDVFL
jgi:hypothetical protein